MIHARLAVDAGCILSAVIGGHGARRVFWDLSSTEFATTAFTLEEVANCFPRLAIRFNVTPGVLSLALKPLPLTVYPVEMYAAARTAAAGMIGDPKDVDLLALALSLECPVWTMDSDFRAAGIRSVSTAELLRALEKR